METNAIIIQATVNAPIEKVWECWTTPSDIIKWNHALDEWHSPSALNDLQERGRFSYRMEAKDGSMGFDFSGVYTKVIINKQIDYSLDDDRQVKITFSSSKGNTEIIETFETENVNTAEMQRLGWQAILNNFKKYVEGK
jgi:uncharacterized protein YndB with AHSA1/START domain